MHDRGTSKDGQFGLPYNVYGGQNPLVLAHRDSLEESFSGCLAHAFDMEERTHSPDEEMRQLRQQRFDKVIPRLLRPLKTQGRSLQPVLVHGDLWDGNVAIDKTTGRPVIFDACPCYAHNEYELAPWWVPRHKIARDYANKYAQLRKPSQPADYFDDCGLVYRL
ncbi:hypothetical protein MCOR07_009148 [Pyricularia oryzae]|uniref:protein-ribulosamine 3-kinase n=2 Tax=Pyricularia TaxID=48558 RepID=A0ABQ8NQ23_PYRGI|nr:hypothetical protein MCOR01_010735 [Pyricularia oryzae]KAI6300264.1 hypothetical protein MCOR33_003945 [Pyricularia grisea]KAI6272106.1 hypothetical protein MCOR26_007513 [Pyricularia oryzae]KAI6319682.1 hypothetical protein MCOR34_003228 [Pyricularia oryzae]KAI6343275.1 hypothetical protein MCOR28_004936 [Pyricularia oryzae]